ncbi:LOW QUALITY PROTEIN: wall-associated receptor kinase 17-like [Typha latifolia]|uniref:LOW QUALITY PROTEIN: wall-associated receptor kinase 17-like n=1 Tax=Typha latifolia TaxID=4733 RepID=UPI003C2B8E25
MVSRWLLLPLLVILLLLWRTPPTSALVVRCKNPEYPFGFLDDGQAFPGFEVICNNGTTMLRLGSRNYPILSTSPLGYLKISALSFAQRCTGGSTVNNYLMDLTGTPYTFSSTQNKLTAIGCNDLLLMRSPIGWPNVTTGCITFCGNWTNVVEGSCSGLGCCQAPIPSGLKSFDLEFNKILNITVPRGNKCSQAFLVEEDSFTFSKNYLRNDLSLGTYFTVVLNWAIGNKTCEEVKSDPGSYACKGNSNCVDSPDGVGYSCKCSQGYEGNPYLEGRCTDINECLDPATNPCVGDCINKPGGVSCACPRGMSGDGMKKGNGCKKTFPLNLAMGVGFGLLLLLLTGSFWAYCGMKKRKLARLKAEFFKHNGGLLLQQRFASQGIDARSKIFTADELKRATNNYSESQILGRGGYGIVYKGILLDHRVVAIKKSRIVDESQIEQFINEITILSQINHRNVVKLLGCCLETQVPLLVYEFISNGTLFHRIHRQHTPNPLPWQHRLRIAAETAGALAYLHSAASLPIIHRDIKSANILLDENYTAKVSDFGASRSVPFDQTHLTTLVQGTIGYLDPEYLHTSQLTEKSDVYSFGVVLAELLTREMPVCLSRSEEQRNLAAYFALSMDERHLLQLIEPEIIREAGVEQIFWVAQLAKRCLSLKGEERPPMKEVARELEGLRIFREQQLIQRNIEELEHFISEAGSQTMTVGEATSSRYTMEGSLLSSMDLPR